MSDHEWIAQVTHQKWANKQIARFFEQIAHLLIFLQKTTDEQIPSPGGQEKEWEVYQGYRNLLFCSFARRYFALGSLLKRATGSYRSLLKTQRERFARVALFKRAKRANCSRCSLPKDWKEGLALLKEQIALPLSKNELFTWTKEWMPNPEVYPGRGEGEV